MWGGGRENPPKVQEGSGGFRTSGRSREAPPEVCEGSVGPL